MSKRTKVKSMHTSLRLAPDVAAELEKAAGLTGWSVARLVGHLAKFAFAVLAENQKARAELAAAFTGAITLHRVELDNARRLAEARAAVRAVVAAPHVRKPRAAAAASTRKPTLPKVAPAAPNSAA